jgi:hypothetical protein
VRIWIVLIILSFLLSQRMQTRLNLVGVPLLGLAEDSRKRTECSPSFALRGGGALAHVRVQNSDTPKF